VLIFNLDSLIPKKKTAPLLPFKPDSKKPPKCWGRRLVLYDSPDQNDSARRPAGFNIACYLNRSCHYNSIAWKAAQHFSYGARGFYARPSERSERLKLFVKRCYFFALSVELGLVHFPPWVRLHE
jgi:hypothetical protein